MVLIREISTISHTEGMAMPMYCLYISRPAGISVPSLRMEAGSIRRT